MKRPLRNFPGERLLADDQEFGPVNIEASITEVAEPSGWAMLLGGTLASQKSALEGYVKDRVTQTLDATEIANAKLASINDASTARDDYEAAYDAAAKTSKSLEAATDKAAKSVARQTFELKLATLRQKEVLARAAFDQAALVFEPLPKIKVPSMARNST